MEQILEDLKASTSLLLKQLSDFNDEAFNIIPPDGGWSAGQITEHVWLVENKIIENFNGHTNSTDRPADKKVALLQTVFGDTSKRYDAPGIFHPSAGVKHKNGLITKLLLERNELSELVKSLDLTETILSFKHPYLGAFTRLEWVYFIIHHSNRHVTQLSRLSG